MSDRGPESGGETSSRWWGHVVRSVREGLGHSQQEMVFDRSNFEDVEQQLWGLSPERRWYMSRRPQVYAGAALGIVLFGAAALLGQPPRSDLKAWWATILAILAICALGYSTFPYWASRLAFNERRRKMASYVASDTLRDIRGSKEIPLNVLFAYNRRQLDAYQEEARNQQRLAFRYALLTSTLGFVVLLAGITVSFRLGPGTEAYVAGGLSAVGAALSAYIAGTMLRISQRADIQLNQFYLEPHMMGRLLLAERLIDCADPEVAIERRYVLIKQVLDWPLPSPAESQAREDAEH